MLLTCFRPKSSYVAFIYWIMGFWNCRDTTQLRLRKYSTKPFGVYILTRSTASISSEAQTNMDWQTDKVSYIAGVELSSKKIERICKKILVITQPFKT